MSELIQVSARFLVEFVFRSGDLAAPFVSYERAVAGTRAHQFVQGKRPADYQAGDRPNQVHLVSVGRTGPPSLHAAALEADLFASVTLRNCLTSWSNVVHTPLARNQLVNAVHGALRCYDLPDLLATLPAEKVTIVEPLNALEEPAVSDD